MVWEAAIGAGSSLLGGFLDRRGAKTDRAAQWAREDSSIQRRVADARKAGIHPLAALGHQASQPYAMPQVGSKVAQGVNRAINQYGQKAALDSQTQLNQKQAEYYEALKNDVVATAKARSDAALNKSNSSNDNTELASTGQVKVTGLERTKPNTIVRGAHGSFKVTPGETKSQAVEDIYSGAAAEIEGFSRYARDKTAVIRKEIRNDLSRFGRVLRKTHNRLKNKYGDKYWLYAEQSPLRK